MSTTETTFDKLSEKDLRRALADAKATMAEVDSASSDEVRLHADELLARYRTAVSTAKEARYELRQRDGQRRSLKSRILHTQDPLAWALQTAALRLGGGVQLVPSRLTEAEAAEIRDLTSRWPELTDEERLRAEHLIGAAAGNPSVFADRRARAQIKRLAVEARRLPQAESIVAAVLADETVVDDLRFRIRGEAVEINDFGTPEPAGAGRVLEPEDIGVLMVLLHAIGLNGGHPVRLGEQGALGDGLPKVDVARVGHLRANGLLTNRRDGNGWLTGYGHRVREIANRWQIDLPEVTSPSRSPAMSLRPS